MGSIVLPYPAKNRVDQIPPKLGLIVSKSQTTLCGKRILLNHHSFMNFIICRYLHSVKKVQIRSFFWSVFSRIRTEYGEILSIFPYSVRMQENAGKMRTGITPNTDIFYAASDIPNFSWLNLSPFIFLCCWGANAQGS